MDAFDQMYIAGEEETKREIELRKKLQKENPQPWNYQVMTKQRYHELMSNFELELTQEEVDEGWHFCNDWDGLLICKDWPESECCYCKD